MVTDWIDLRAAEKTVEMKEGEFKDLIPLGRLAVQLPQGYEMQYCTLCFKYIQGKNFKVFQTNSMGIIDESYCGDDDQLFFRISYGRYHNSCK